MVTFDERDLLTHAEQAGFTDLGLDYQATITAQAAPAGLTWDAFIAHAPNPLVPPLREILAEALTPAEQDALAAHIQRQIEMGQRRRRLATTYLTARRP